MKKKYGKFFLALAAHGVLFILTYSIANQVLGYDYAKRVEALFPLMFHLAYNTVYFMLLWLKLYNHDYAYFLHFSVKTVLRSLATTILVVAVFIGVTLIGNRLLRYESNLFSPLERYLAVAGIMAVMNSSGFLALFAVQYLWVHHLISLGYLKKNVLIVGEPDARFPLASLLNGNEVKNFQGRLFRRGTSWFYSDLEHDLRRVEQEKIPDVLFHLKIGEVIIFLCDSLTQKDVHAMIALLAENGINYYLVPEIVRYTPEQCLTNVFPYVPIIMKYTSRRDSVTQITVKRFIDIVFVALSMFLVFPLGVLIAFLIKLGDGGPVFYSHERIGINGKVIRFYKFRSMIVNADALQAGLLAYNLRENGPLFKMKDDPRLTPLGKIIRRFSLDELPQLLNVLKGDISLVGPRPHLVSEVNAYAARDRLRLECIPGLTCLPQINGRDSISFKKWVELDLSYRKKWSLLLDLKILIRSLNEVVSPLYKNTYEKPKMILELKRPMARYRAPRPRRWPVREIKTGSEARFRS